ncbi:MAG TPA: DUF364 domain-containing protein [Halobacteriales archaeon]|nr:DUF364 domain-containing protein [Halobacteriales archaeon]
MAGTSLLDAVYDSVAERSPLSEATVDRVVVGDRLLLVEVDDVESADGDRRSAGAAHRPPGVLDEDPAGARALDVASWATGSSDSSDPLRRAVGVAALNALSEPLMDWATGDPFEALASDVSAIATVGLFGPAFRKFGAVDVRVIERQDLEPPETPEGVSVSTYGPDEAEAAIDGVDVVFVTGSTLLYGGTERYLEAARDVPDVVLVGATASFVPEPAFEAGATMLAGARVTDAEAVRRGAVAGECATDLHDEGMEKVYVTAAVAGGLELDETPGSEP